MISETRERVRSWLQEWFEGIEKLEFEPGVRLIYQLDATVEEMVEQHAMAPVPSGAVFEPDVEYNNGLTLQLYRRADASERAPAVVFIHGGGWAGGHPYLHIRHASELAAQGYVAAAISYRLAPEAVWPAAYEDCVAAVDWLRSHARSLGLDETRIAAAGGSAGGHLSALVALRGHARTAVCWYPMTDMRSAPPAVGPVVDAFLAGADPLEASPIAYITADSPPVLSMAGSGDVVTPLAMIRAFHDELDAAGVDNELVVYPDAPHGFDFNPAAWQDCVRRMKAWLASRL